MLDFCMQKGILLDKNVLNSLEEIEDESIAKNFVERIEYQYKPKIITSSFFKNNSEIVVELLSNYKGENKKRLEYFFEKLGLDLKNFDLDSVKNVESEKKHSSEDESVSIYRVYQNNPKKLEVLDFVNNFRYRFNTLKGVLQQRPELDNLISINRLSGNNSSFSIIGLVFDKRVTKNGNVILEVEDTTGFVKALVTKARGEVYEKTKEVLLDDVVGLKCSGNNEMVFVNDVIFPDMKISEPKKSKFDECAAFISDIHVGSDKFLERNFLKFISWLNGEVGDDEQKKEALKIKYLFVTGDSIDGVGIYPGQESQLIIKDVNEQYKKLSEILLKIRDDVKIILCPGQHDAVRVAEPQPIIGEYFGSCMRLVKNLYLITNPGVVEIGKDVKFKVLMYHGASMHGIINNIEDLRLGKGHDSPTDVVKYMLKKRHLAPTHSLVTYTPFDGEDALLIKEIPDIISTGDLHRPEIANYNGVLLVASSCWQSKTPFEEKVGNHPDPCKVPVLNLNTRDVKIMDFSEGLDSQGNWVGGENAD